MAPAMATANAKPTLSAVSNGQMPSCGQIDSISDDPSDEDDCPKLIGEEIEGADSAVSAQSDCNGADSSQTKDATNIADYAAPDTSSVMSEARPATIRPIVTQVTRETQTECSPISAEALKICLDVVDMALKKNEEGKFWNSWHPRSEASDTMYRLVNEILDGHSIVYKSMVEKLELASRHNYWSVKSMCDEVFRGGEISWGRIVALYAVCVQLARSCQQRQQVDEMAYSVADTIGVYVGSVVGEWIDQKGGWNALVKEFPPKDDVQNKVWKGLLVTGLGLGMFATVIKAIR